jgi:hypothetical protein
MSRVVVTTNLTLDGVMQSSSHSDEDRRGGSSTGAGAPPFADDVVARVMAKGIERGGNDARFAPGPDGVYRFDGYEATSDGHQTGVMYRATVREDPELATTKPRSQRMQPGKC